MPTLYRLLTSLAAPLIAFYLWSRKRKGREDSARFHERLGIASTPRPSGPLLWCHGASVGEAMSVLALIKKLRERYPAYSILLTTGTVASAQILATRLPEGVTHHYVPVDRWPYVERFLNHWKPDVALWVESELWPNMLTALAARHIPVILVNGRMSEKSYARWRMLSGGIKQLMQTFVLGLAQTGGDKNRLAALGLRDVRAIGNLKFAAEPLPVDEQSLQSLKNEIGSRPVWVIASTHPGEDEIALAVHRKLHRSLPDILTVIVPRHPARAAEITALIDKESLPFARRTQGQPITHDTQIYLADTMGELGLFYRLATVCCLAGSFTWGGHNPVEPAQLGLPIVIGPRMDNFAVMADDMLASGAAIQVMDETELAEVTLRLLQTPNEANALVQKATAWAAAKQGVMDETLKALDPFLTKKVSP